MGCHKCLDELWAVCTVSLSGWTRQAKKFLLVKCEGFLSLDSLLVEFIKAWLATSCVVYGEQRTSDEICEASCHIGDKLWKWISSVLQRKDESKKSGESDEARQSAWMIYVWSARGGGGVSPASTKWANEGLLEARPRLKTIKWGGFEFAMPINWVNNIGFEIYERSEEHFEELESGADMVPQPNFQKHLQVPSLAGDISWGWGAMAERSIKKRRDGRKKVQRIKRGWKRMAEEKEDKRADEMKGWTEVTCGGSKPLSRDRRPACQ